MRAGNSLEANGAIPQWVPTAALHYLAHTEFGEPIRALAREAGCHASTILRQIRKFEMRRDDPLVDAALRQLGPALHDQTGAPAGSDSGQVGAHAGQGTSSALPDEETLNREAIRVLRRLCETGAVLAVAAEMDKAVVVRDTAGGGSTRTAVVAATVAQAMALKEWIAAANTGRIVRYHITAAGRAALEDMLHDHGSSTEPVAGFAEDQTPFAVADEGWEEELLADAETPQRRRMRYALAESPLIALSRKRDIKGKPFLSDALVHAGERLREDYELAQMGGSGASAMNGATSSGEAGLSGDAPSEARARVAEALAELGPGLSDIALRCCCYLEGLEMAEKRLGWSARSAKIVLRIALMRLSRHYEKTIGPGGPMIG